MHSIEQVPDYVVWPIRQQVMYPDYDIEQVKLQDDASGIHLALFDHNTLVTVVSLFKTDNNLQFRKLATLNEFQGKGYGSKLLQYVIQFAQSEGCEKIWCNSRVSAASFYKRFGFKETPKRFTKHQIEFVVMELTL